LFLIVLFVPFLPPYLSLLSTPLLSLLLPPSLPADRAPSVLNGGLTNEWIIGTGVFSLVLGAVLELKGMEMVSIVSYRIAKPEIHMVIGSKKNRIESIILTIVVTMIIVRILQCSVQGSLFLYLSASQTY
jgi:hypothetical protein